MTTNQIRALSVQQPWAELIRAGLKDVENRTWRTTYRGPIAVHASKLADRHAVLPTEESRAIIADAADQRTLRFGAIIAVAEITDMHMCNGRCSPWAARGQWHWVLANAQPLTDPISAAGRLGLWDLPNDVQAALHDQLAAELGR